MLYDFSALKLYVREKFGVNSDAINSRFVLIKESFFSKTDLDKQVEINPDNIIFTDKKGNKHKGFLYIEGGYSQRTIEISGTRLPKFHILNCKTIQKQKQIENFNGHYVFSNRAETMEEIDGSIQELRLCGNCSSSNFHHGAFKGMTTSVFREKFILNGVQEGQFFDNDLPKSISVNFWGYTPDWDATSKNYRMKKEFTCENCGIKLNQTYANGYYLETHHIDGNKKNNDEDNLKCLCVLCHASVDKFHQENYSKGSGRQKLRDFIKQFEDELRRIGNQHLNRYKPG